MTSPAVSRKQVRTVRPVLTLVESHLPDDPFLLARFERFYEELLACKWQHAGQVRGFAPLPAEDIHGRLLAFLQDQQEEVSRTSTLLGAEMYRQAQRVMACLADEIFSPVSWPAGASWPSLEMALFEADKHYGLSPDGPCMMKLEPLLMQDDAAYRELAAVYFYALAVSENAPDHRDRYLRPLAEMIGAAGGKVTASGRVFGQSYAHTLEENRVAALPSARRWWLTLAAIALVWLSVSWLLWAHLSEPIESELQKLQITK